ncbi:Type II secretion system (T2SS), protein M subtype b [Nitrosomonas eutropha]|nr:type II secretion system protein M [Nitrosomonas sp. GH22]SCX16267.1 Type II secretion system (T2SS), protein M subtype b [Nitrosomonas eutropha]
MARRALALAVGVLLLTSLWSIVVRLLYVLPATTIERLNDTRFELHRLQALAIEHSDFTPDDLIQLEQSVAVLVFPSSNDNAVFVDAVNVLIHNSGVQLLELRTADPFNDGNLTRFALDVRINAPEEKLVHLLTLLERHRPLLIIDRAVVLATAAASDDTSSPLSVELRIWAFAAEH